MSKSVADLSGDDLNLSDTDTITDIDSLIDNASLNELAYIIEKAKHVLSIKLTKDNA